MAGGFYKPLADGASSPLYGLLGSCPTYARGRPTGRPVSFSSAVGVQQDTLRERSAARRVAVVQHQVVPVGIGEEGHVAHPGVERVTGEHDAFGLQFRARRGHVVDVQREVGVLLRRERHSKLLGFPDAEARVP